MDYHEPVSRLLELGEEPARQHPWPDYLEIGFTVADVPELVRLAGDQEVFDLEGEVEDDNPRWWGPIHARRVLGQLRAANAVAPLIRLLEWDDTDWGMEEIPRVMALMGPAALGPLQAALDQFARQDPDREAAGTVAAAIQQVGAVHPDARDEAVSMLTHQLRQWAEQDPELNGMLVSNLIDLRAVEAAPLMAEAFAEDAVDDLIVGDWEDVQVELGLISERTTPRNRDLYRGLGLLDEPSRPSGQPGAAQAKKKARQQKKAQKAARKKGRQKKR